MNRVLVTGAAGFIGSHTLPMLLAAGYEVHAASSRSAMRHQPGVHWHIADLLSSEQRHELIQRVAPSHLLHLAWYVPPGSYWTAFENVSWLEASVDLLRRFAGAGGHRCVCAGTCAEYDWSRGGDYRETDPSQPATLYGACKSSLYLISSRMAAQLKIDIAWGRVFMPYGPGEPRQRLVPLVIESLLAGRPALCTQGLQVRDYIFVEDVARAFVMLLDSSHVGPVNVGSGSGIAVREIVSLIGKLIGRPELLEIGAVPTPPFEPSRLVADTALLRSLGFRPAYGIEEGLERTVDWWRSRVQHPAIG